MAGLVQKFKEMWIADEDYDYEEEVEQEEKEEVKSKSSSSRVRSESDVNNRVVNIHSNEKVKVVLFRPEKFGEDTRNIADELLKVHTIVLNLEETNKDSSRRIVDFLSGVAYALGGKIKKVATDTFVITPYNVDIAGDDTIDELENGGVYI